MSVRFTVFQAAAVGIGHEQADDIVAKLEAGAVAGAHTWISESSPPHGSEPQCEDGWFAGETATPPATCCASPTPPCRAGRTASSAMLLAAREEPPPRLGWAAFVVTGCGSSGR
ncbi:hypothetical protein [Streptomyces erythrochromogenes]|uniref:hypothetical protein n=1 Tax=Streptomyces erythrochromogenes TaxID=285574 RepID=UPI0037FF5D32